MLIFILTIKNKAFWPVSTLLNRKVEPVITHHGGKVVRLSVLTVQVVQLPGSSNHSDRKQKVGRRCDF